MDLEFLNFTELRDAEIVGRMRKFNYEKFKTLVRMHLSFELDLNTDEFDLPCHEIVYEDKGKLKKWNRLSKKHKHGVAGGCTALVVANKSCNSTLNQNVNSSPTESSSQQIDSGFLFHLRELKEFLMLEKNLQQEGIFRKNGSVSRQNDLRSQIQNDNPLDLEAVGYSAHDCATVFKGYLSELYEPLLTDAHYPAHLQIAPLCICVNNYIVNKLNQEKSTNADNAERVKKELHVLNSIQLLLLLLPDENRQLLQHIIDILNAVAQHHSINKMGPDNLATLFAPHLICPRNLPPEALHYLAKKMSSIIAYMIIRGQDIFCAPAKLATDIRAYFLERKRKKTMSPEMTLDESISDISTVNTVYTFVDREKTAAAHNANTTDTELAQLYAHIQSLPESSKKRRLIKQFNKQNGQGTPLQLQAMNRVKNSELARSSKSLSDSIKKHIFHKGIMSRTPKRQPLAEGVLGTPNNASMKVHKQRILFSSPNPQTFVTHSANTPLLLSSSSSVLTTSNNTANSNTLYNIKSHPLQKSISSSSLLMKQQHYEVSARAGHSSNCCTTNLVHNHHGNNSQSSDGILYNTKSVSAPVSRQTSSDLQKHTNITTKSLPMSSTSLPLRLSDMNKYLDVNCCAPEHFTVAAGGPVDKKSVAWEDAHLKNTEYIYNPSILWCAATNPNDLKSRYKSEPNLSMSYSVCDTTNTSIGNRQGSYEEVTPITKHIGRSLTRKLMKGVSMGNLKFPFSTPDSTKRFVRTVSSTLKRRSSDDSQIYQQAEGSFIAAFRSGNVPLLEDMDDNNIEEEYFEEQECDAETETEKETEDNKNEYILKKSSNVRTDALSATGTRSSNSSDLTNSLAGGLQPSYKQLLLHKNGLYQHNVDLVTSTPSLLHNRRSMSPITKSTQRMPKAMQESIMTPRSRKPVMVLTSSTITSSEQNQNQENSKHKSEETESIEDFVGDNDIDNSEDCLMSVGSLHPSCTSDEPNITTLPKPEVINEDATSLGGYSEILKRQHLLQANQTFAQEHSVGIDPSSDSDFQTGSAHSNVKDFSSHNQNITNADTLTSNFKEYLLTRSVLTAPPEDTSFTSHSDDFNSSHEIEELDTNRLSSSLLFCLDGNRPETRNDSNITAADTIDTAPNINEVNLATNKNVSISNTTSSSSMSNSSSSYCSNDSNNSNSSTYIPIITNRLANNPFVILNNARKRAATEDFDKISATLFNSQMESPNFSHTSYQTGLKFQHASTTTKFDKPNNKLTPVKNLTTNSNSSSNKENCEQNENYLLTKKVLISEYTGETSF